MTIGVNRLRVAMVCPTLLKFDGVGETTYDMAKNLGAMSDVDLTLLSRNNEFRDLKHTHVSSVADVLLNPGFRSADAIVYSFASHSGILDAMLVGNGRGVQVARFHNVTPEVLVDGPDREKIQLSLLQLHNLSAVDRIWADSHENRLELGRRGIDCGTVDVQPLPVRAGKGGALAAKSTSSIQILYVGRFVESKGIPDLLEAFAVLRRSVSIPVSLTLIGNQKHSPEGVLASLREHIGRLGISDAVDVVGTADSERLAHAYSAAHIFVSASRHEGFCVPVVEGLAAGCIPVTYSNSNFRFAGGRLGRTTVTDTPEALSETLIAVVTDLMGGSRIRLDGGDLTAEGFDIAAKVYVANYEPHTVAERMRQALYSLVNRPQ